MDSLQKVRRSWELFPKQHLPLRNEALGILFWEATHIHIQITWDTFLSILS